MQRKGQITLYQNLVFFSLRSLKTEVISKVREGEDGDEKNRDIALLYCPVSALSRKGACRRDSLRKEPVDIILLLIAAGP